MKRELYESSALLSAKIRELRCVFGLTQKKIAARAEVSVGAVCDLEQTMFRALTRARLNGWLRHSA